jgi:hypothetical protein
LTRVVLTYCRVTPEGIDELKKALPKLKVER